MRTSSRGLPLIYQGTEHVVPVITMEFYLKWYALQVVMPDGTVEEHPFPDEDGRHDSPYVDHAPNPTHVLAYAKRVGFEVDDASLEMIAGRFFIEGMNGLKSMPGDHPVCHAGWPTVLR